MDCTPIRLALLSSVAALTVTAAQAQEQPQEQPQADQDPQACATLAERLGQDTGIDAEVRTRVEDVISSGSLSQCSLIVTAWDREGSLSANALELVATEEATQRVIVQQEVEIDADAAVYQPPAEVQVTTGTPEVVWNMPRQSVTVEEQAPEISVRQGQPQITVEIPQPRVTVMMPEPEITVTWPDPAVNVAAVEPMIEVRIPEPQVTVNMPEPIVELTIGGAAPEGLVQLDDGRFAPQGTTPQDLEPRIAVDQPQPTITRDGEALPPELVLNRGEPVVNFERADPQVFVQQVGEPEVRVMVGPDDAATDESTAPQP